MVIRKSQNRMSFWIYFFFFRNNFLKLDVYYGALQDEEVNQLEAYGPLDYLGN